MFNESKEDLIQEILSNSGWKEVYPTNKENWISQLEYNLNDNVYILILETKNLKDLTYYLVNDYKYYFVSEYTNNYTQLYSEYDTIYRDMSNYDRMIRICNYLLPFFTKKPSDDIMYDIKECFIEIEDQLSVEPEIIWGYCNENEIGYFPSYRFSDSLALCLSYIHDSEEIDFDKIEEEFNLIKNRLESFDIHVKSRVSIINDYRRIIIKIKF
jgi:hypothetical protein